jgi:hypothetical protein
VEFSNSEWRALADFNISVANLIQSVKTVKDKIYSVTTLLFLLH